MGNLLVSDRECSVECRRPEPDGDRPAIQNCDRQREWRIRLVVSEFADPQPPRGMHAHADPSLRLVLGILFFAGVGALTAASRCTYAFARYPAIFLRGRVAI